jgi:hypothetical protein
MLQEEEGGHTDVMACCMLRQHAIACGTGKVVVGDCSCTQHNKLTTANALELCEPLHGCQIAVYVPNTVRAT